MEEPKPTEATTEAAPETPVMTTPEAAPEKPKRKRSPRKPKEAAVAAAPKKERKAKMVHEVRQEGKHIVLSGTDVTIAKLTPKQREAAGIKDVQGKMGVPCAEPVVLTFKSEKAAERFFENCFTDEDGTHDFIDTGSKTSWLSDNIADMLS